MKLTKKIVFAVLISLMVIGVMSCQRSAPSGGTARPAADTRPFPGKLAIVTSNIAQNEEEFRSAEQLVRKYGAENVIHVTWPENFMAEQEQMVTILSRLAVDRDIKALVINQSVPGTNAAVDRFKESRDDVFIVYCSPQENPPDVSRRANLLINNDQIAIGPVMVDQAVAQGAKVFVHYSFPRHMAQPLLSGRRDAIRENAARLGIQYVDATAPDPTGDGGLPAAQQFILEDVPRMIARYGQDTAFFATNCGMQSPLIRTVVDGGAIYPQPCCPSPYHGFPSALGIDTPPAGQGLADINFVINETRRLAADKNMTGRLSTWPVPAAMMFTNAGAEYAVKWMKGEVPRTGIDERALADCINQYIREVTGATVETAVRAHSEGGVTYDNYKLVLMGYLTY
jgi:hypothetical protein